MIITLEFTFGKFSIFIASVGLAISVYSYVDVDAGIVARDGVTGLYRGFVPNVLKTLPNSRFLVFSCCL